MSHVGPFTLLHNTTAKGQSSKEGVTTFVFTARLILNASRRIASLFSTQYKAVDKSVQIEFENSSAD